MRAVFASPQVRSASGAFAFEVRAHFLRGVFEQRRPRLVSARQQMHRPLRDQRPRDAFELRHLRHDEVLPSSACAGAVRPSARRSCTARRHAFAMRKLTDDGIARPSHVRDASASACNAGVPSALACVCISCHQRYRNTARSSSLDRRAARVRRTAGARTDRCGCDARARRARSSRRTVARRPDGPGSCARSRSTAAPTWAARPPATHRAAIPSGVHVPASGIGASQPAARCGSGPITRHAMSCLPAISRFCAGIAARLARRKASSRSVAYAMSMNASRNDPGKCADQRSASASPFAASASTGPHGDSSTSMSTGVPPATSMRSRCTCKGTHAPLTR